MYPFNLVMLIQQVADMIFIFFLNTLVDPHPDKNLSSLNDLYSLEVTCLCRQELHKRKKETTESTQAPSGGQSRGNNTVYNNNTPADVGFEAGSCCSQLFKQNTSKLRGFSRLLLCHCKQYTGIIYHSDTMPNRAKHKLSSLRTFLIPLIISVNEDVKIGYG